ncbi:MAG: flavodoxin family protein, partial [Deltaproteobacteria bacterium]|nr:flavodoxin family protein [Deltaproteobacteria bacterium]
NFVQAVCDDLGMNFVDSLSLDLRDLDKLEARQQLLLFGRNFISAIENQAATTRRFQPLKFSDFEYRPGPAKPSVETLGKKVLVLTDKYDPETNLGRMIDRFRSSFTQEVELIDLRDIDIKGACLGCMRCGYDYTCAYKDGFKEFYNKRVRAADCIVFAGEMRGRYLSSLWKTFYDRAFFWNHTPSLTGKQLAYLVSGPISQNANLLQILEASSTARQEANHVDVLSDEWEDSAGLDRTLQGLARKLIQFSVEGYQRPQNFLAVGGHKIFRDNIWGRLRIIWQADHRHYKKTGYYDFPQQKYALRLLMGLGMLVTKIPFVRKKFYDNMLTGPRRRMSKIAETAD